MWYNKGVNVDVDTINHLAELSNFSISEKEAESLKKDLGEILKYVSQLDSVDVSDVEPTYQVFEMENVWRDDEILPQEASREDLLALSREQKDNQVKVPKVL
ncbi:Asp-tRNA(Asn)/Glu-tRNA(Gln) amidotransferase subunit GatC [Candidatus Saccharibacteria bacterium]|nr:Asp-tRNA(Asn)/Glu-tRNA(Gln) amidotransferase subunit GatC [Candidatus Saccharibacteria bacterium]